MISTTLGKLLIEDALPEELRGSVGELDKKGIQKLFQQLAEKYPDKYREISHKLMQVGADAAYASGGYSFGLKHLLPAKSAIEHREKVRREVDQILESPNLSDDEKEKQIILAAGRARQPMEKAIYDESLAEKNPLALQVLSGAKGNPTNLRSLRGGDLLYVDHHDREIPIPVLRSYSEGLSPAEFFAGAFGARHGVVSVKLGTAQSGYYAKLLTQAAHRLLVTAKDHEKEPDPESSRGLPASVHDHESEGSLLAVSAGPYDRNTPITSRILEDLKRRGIEKILIRSPMVGGPQDGGVYAADAGIRERGGLPPIGDFVGVTAAAAIGEPLSQGALSKKHSGGVAGSNQTVSGFELLEQLIQIPSSFPGGAAHAQLDGHVDAIREAPQGGQYISIGGQDHYVAPGLAPKVKPGDKVEAGDILSNGIANPAEVVHHKGIGEGRRQFLEQYRKAAKEAGFNFHRRNLELITRGLINHVRLTDELGDHVPDDVIPYQTLEHVYEPRPGHQRVTPSQAVGKYLERPVLHHTIGTQLKPSMIRELEEHGVKGVTVHHEPPPFVPEMVRAQSNLSADPDFMSQMLGSNLERNLLRSAHRGATSDPHGTSYVPSLARGLGFGAAGKVQGWKPEDLAK